MLSTSTHRERVETTQTEAFERDRPLRPVLSQELFRQLRSPPITVTFPCRQYLFPYRLPPASGITLGVMPYMTPIH